jgi:hypothetical protein
MKKRIIFLILSCLIMLTLLAISCGGQETTTTSTTTTSTTTAPTTTTTTTTTSTTQTTTQTQTTTTTTTTTSTQNPFHGSVSGNWTGRAINGGGVQGAFSVTIDENGDITGTFTGNYAGTITGHVDESGNLNAIGNASLGGQYIQFIWQGTASITGTTINTQGTWSGGLASGVFSGTGTTS